MQVMIQRDVSMDAGREAEYVEVYTEIPFAGSLAAVKTIERIEAADLECGKMLVAAVVGLAAEQPEMTMAEFRELVFRHLQRSVLEHMLAELHTINTRGRV